MATYNYKCEHCEDRFEVEQSVHDAPLITCNKCNTDTLIKIIIPGTSFRIGGKGVHRPTSMFDH